MTRRAGRQAPGGPRARVPAPPSSPQGNKQQVAAPPPASHSTHLGAGHEQDLVVGHQGHGAGQGVEKRGPAGARLELGLGGKQRRGAAGAAKRAGAVLLRGAARSGQAGRQWSGRRVWVRRLCSKQAGKQEGTSMQATQHRPPIPLVTTTHVHQGAAVARLGGGLAQHRVACRAQHAPPLALGVAHLRREGCGRLQKAEGRADRLALFPSTPSPQECLIAHAPLPPERPSPLPGRHWSGRLQCPRRQRPRLRGGWQRRLGAPAAAQPVRPAAGAAAAVAAAVGCLTTMHGTHRSESGCVRRWSLGRWRW